MIHHFPHHYLINSPSILEIFANISQILMVIIAFQALNSWREQMKGGGKYTVSKNLLIGTKKVQDIIQKTVRNPAISPKEIDKERSEKNYEYLVYQKRLKEMYDYKREVFDGYAIEAEVLLEQSIKEKISEFNKKISELRGSIYIAYGVLSGEDEYDKKIWEQMKEKINNNRELLWNTGLENDKYSNELDASVKEIEKELSKYIS